MDINQAIEELKSGKKVFRSGWNKDMFVIYFMEASIGTEFLSKEELEKNIELPFLILKTENNELVPWVASQEDIISEDWGIYQ
jgi:ribosomal protein L1